MRIEMFLLYVWHVFSLLLLFFSVSFCLVGFCAQARKPTLGHKHFICSTLFTTRHWRTRQTPCWEVINLVCEGFNHSCIPFEKSRECGYDRRTLVSWNELTLLLVRDMVVPRRVYQQLLSSGRPPDPVTQWPFRAVITVYSRYCLTLSVATSHPWSPMLLEYQIVQEDLISLSTGISASQ